MKSATIPNYLCSSFIGREADLRALHAALDAGRPLVSIVGDPGVGKTRLAIEALGAQDDSCALFCDASSCTSYDEFALAVAHMLGLSEPAEYLIDALSAHGPALLVIDNAEHLVAELSAVIPTWIEKVPGLRLLVTTRERLRLEIETVIRLEPLDLSDAESSAETLLSPSVQLFIDRARAADHSFSAAEDMDNVVELVRLLDGLPLAIEIAASRVAALGLRGIIDRAESTLCLLDRPERGRPNRHAGLRTAIGVSWTLLNPIERRVLSLLAISRGPLKLSWLEKLLPDLGKDRTSNIVQDLHDKSLLRSTPGRDSPKFHLLRATAEFVREQLEASERATISARLDDYFIAYGEELAAQRFSPGAKESLREIMAIAPHLQGIIDCDSVVRRRAQAALALQPAVIRYGPYPQRIRVFTSLLIEGLFDDPVLLARVRMARSRLYEVTGETALAVRDLEEAQVSTEDGPLMTEILYQMAGMELAQSYFSQARVLYHRCSESAIRQQERVWEGIALGGLARLERKVGNHQQSAVLYKRAISIDREVGNRLFEAVHTGNLGVAESDRGRIHAAERRFRTAIELFEELRSERDVAIFRCNLGIVRRLEGHVDEGWALIRDALATLRSAGASSDLAHCLPFLGDAWLDMGDPDQALASQEEAAERLSELGERQRLPLVHARCALAAAIVGDVLAARVRIDLAMELAESEEVQVLVDVYRRVVATYEVSDSAKDSTDPSQGLPAGSEEGRNVMGWLQRRLQERFPADNTLVVGPTGRWFRLGMAPIIDLAAKPQLAKVLDSLARARVSTQAPLEVDTLFERAWGGERADAAARRNRVRVTIASLRKLGLRDRIKSQEGYIIDRMPFARGLTPWAERVLPQA